MITSTRELDRKTLDNAAREWAGEFLRPTRFSSVNPKNAISGRGWVLDNFVKAGYKDEIEYLMEKFKNQLGPDALKEFKVEGDNLGFFSERDQGEFEQMLSDNLAIFPDGTHIEGKIGKTIVGTRDLGVHMVEVEHRDSIRRRKRLELGRDHRETHVVQAKKRWNIYAGEDYERAAESGVATPFPKSDGLFLSMIKDEAGALTTRIGNAAAQDACDGVVDLLDEGTLGAVLQGRTTPRPAQVDDAVTGTNLFTVTYSTTAFGAAGDGAPGGLATAAAVTDDSSADATGTLLYCRVSSSSVADTPLNDHLEGEAGTSGADFNFNTLSIVIASTVSLTSHTVTMPES
jgi:hypothetical protein